MSSKYFKQKKAKATASLESSSPPHEVPSEIADSSPFPTTLRRSSTVPISPSSWHPTKEKRVRDRNDASDLEDGTAASTKVCQEFESHYGLLQCSVRSVLQELLEDMANNRDIHSWDQKLFVSPTKRLEKAVRTYVREHADLDMSSLLVGMAVEAVATTHGSTVRKSPLHSDVPNMLFHTKFKSAEVAQQTTQGTSKQPSHAIKTSASNDTHHGRIILMIDGLPPAQRAVLLMLSSLCIRLQNEDHAYILSFMERHLSLRNSLCWPSQLQRMSSPQMSSSKQRIYKRVTLSSHMTYLKAVTTNGHGNQPSDLDQEPLVNSRGTATEATDDTGIVKTTTSVLLTIALPEESLTNQEELDLLTRPQGFWTVMVVNCHERLAKDMEREPTQHLTPLAQFLRGLTYSLRTQNMNAEAIYDQVKERLRHSDDGSLFDDKQFTKSNLYHWAVKTCDELRESLMASQRYMTRTFDRKITSLCEKNAHGTEKHGVSYWKTEHDTEMHALEELISQIAALCSSVQERRNALHGVTAVLEARVALQQGECIKILAYLATIYLPLTASSSLYSMSVLPNSATLWSFFIVFIAFLLGTALIAASIKPVIASLRAKIQIDVDRDKLMPHTPAWLRVVLNVMSSFYHKTGLHSYVQYYVDIIAPERDSEHGFTWRDVFEDMPDVHGVKKIVGFLIKLPYLLIHTWPKALVREALTREVLFLRDQYDLYQDLKRNDTDAYWSPFALIRDFFRVLFIPVWCILIVAIIALLIVEDFLFPVLVVVGSPFALCCFCFTECLKD